MSLRSGVRLAEARLRRRVALPGKSLDPWARQWASLLTAAWRVFPFEANEMKYKGARPITVAY